MRLYGTAGDGWYSVRTEKQALDINAVTRPKLDAFATLGVEVVFAALRRGGRRSGCRAPTASFHLV